MQTVDSDLRALQEEMARLRRDIAEIAETLRKAVRSGQHEVIQRTRQTSSRLVEDAGRTARAVVHEIEERPLTISLAAGVTVAVALSLLFFTRYR